MALAKTKWADSIVDGYEVSKTGNIRKKAIPPRQHHWSIKCTMNTTGYLTITRNHKKYLIHRLIATAFIPNPQNKPFINHLNGVRNDNRIENLEWCTAGENNHHSMYVLGKRVIPISVFKNGVLLQRYPSKKMAAREIKTTVLRINRSLRLGTLHKGFSFSVLPNPHMPLKCSTGGVT